MSDAASRNWLTWVIGLSTCIVLPIVCLILLVGSGLRPTRLMRLASPDWSHHAELFRIDSIDRNYIVWVDGQKVYDSPDFRTRDDLAYRETLIWDRSGRIVVLEVAKHRLFGYDASNRRELTTDELLAVEFPPDPPLEEYGFESEWPGVRGEEMNGGPEASPNPVAKSATGN